MLSDPAHPRGTMPGFHAQAFTTKYVESEQEPDHCNTLPKRIDRNERLIAVGSDLQSLYTAARHLLDAAHEQLA
ncbi:MAG TPA: hypothetical protein PLG97_07675 [Alcaligenes sp.]|nr:hypothetical protein [Alcaligenes sp.]HRL27382.1 hypothetical protein [Alcaligenes sp.]